MGCLENSGSWSLTLSPRAQSWQTTKNALISCAVYVPVAVTMISIAWSSKKHKERNLHGGIPVLISGVAFLCAPPARLIMPAYHKEPWLDPVEVVLSR